MTNAHFFFRYLKGNWFVQENSFLFKNKTQKKSEECFKFNLHINNYLSNRITIDENKNQLQIILNKSNKKLINKLFLKIISISYYKKLFFSLKVVRKGLFKISTYNFHTAVKREEYLYIVNKNMIITVVIIKSLEGQYLAAKLSSYIRLKGN